MENKSKELTIAIKAALAAGEILEKYFETEINKETKDDNTIVTIADKESEEVIKKIILDNFPKHSIIGEETGHTDNASQYTWHIDPIDGTRNFANGIPFFAISIALVNSDRVVLGVVYNPVMQALFYGELDKGAYFNDKKIHVSKDDKSKCIVTVSSGKKAEDVKLRHNLMHFLPEGVVSSVRDFGCIALDLAYVARGNIESAIGFGFKTYDFAAGALLVTEAGGRITKLDGSPWKFPENYFIASNGVFHDVLVAEVQKQKISLRV